MKRTQIANVKLVMMKVVPMNLMMKVLAQMKVVMKRKRKRNQNQGGGHNGELVNELT